jgi:hypothetical protein
MLQRFVALDRRWIFLAIAVAVVLPFALNLMLPTGDVSPRARKVYDEIEALKPGSVVVLVYDYGPASMPELQPMALALTRHALLRGLRVLAMTLGTQGTLLADDVHKQIAKDLPDKKDGTDYVNLGYKVGYQLVILQMGDSLPSTFPKDAHGRSTKTLPVMRGLRNHEDIQLVIDLASGDTPRTWVLYWHQQFNKAALAIGVTAVMAIDYYPFLDTGQVVGMLNGLRGAADYEKLINHPDKAMLGMAAQSIAHLAIILFVILGNIGYFALRAKRGR